MSQQLKRWESPRYQGRNRKGKGGSARQRQKRKQLSALRQKLKADRCNYPNFNSPDLSQKSSPSSFFVIKSAVN